MEQVSKKLLHLTTLFGEELEQVKRMADKFKLNESLDELRRSGKPFYWVDHQRLKKLKQLVDEQTDEGVR